MQDQLHVGRETWPRILRFYAIFIPGVALPYLLGLHWRQVSGGDMDDGRKWAQYGGFGPTEYYSYTENQTVPLFILVPIGFRESNIHGMTRVVLRRE